MVRTRSARGVRRLPCVLLYGVNLSYIQRSVRCFLHYIARLSVVERQSRAQSTRAIAGGHFYLVYCIALSRWFGLNGVIH